MHAPWLRWLPAALRQRLANYIENNLGALTGNIAFGLMLGMTGFVGLMLGLPIDIRHVTFSAANLAYGAAASGWAIEPRTFALLGAGVLAVGLVNLAISFSLALWTAFRANGIRIRDGGRLAVLLGRRLRRRPLAFFWPPASPAARERP
jgi:site-specific recombinase